MMGLRDAISGANLAVWTTVALVMFFVIFVAIAAWAYSRPRQQIEQWRRQPLSDD